MPPSRAGQPPPVRAFANGGVINDSMAELCASQARQVRLRYGAPDEFLCGIAQKDLIEMMAGAFDETAGDKWEFARHRRTSSISIGKSLSGTSILVTLLFPTSRYA